MVKKLMVLVVVVLLIATVAVGCNTPSGTPVEETPAAETEGVAAEEATNEASEKPAEETGEAAVAKSDLDIVWVHMSPAAQSEQRAFAGFMEYIESQGWGWKITEVNSDGSGEKMASNIEDAVAKGCDAIIVSMADLRASANALKTANNAGIPVFSIDSQYTEGLVCDITSNNYVMSSKVSSYLVDRLGGVGNVVALTMAEHHGVRKRGDVFINVILPENPGIVLLDNHNIDYGNFYADCQKTAEDWVAKYGADIDAIWCGWDEPAMAASDAIKAGGFTRADTFVTGIDGHEGAIDAIRNGDPLVATVAQGFEIMGQKCADIIQQSLGLGNAINDVVKVTTMYIDAPLLTDQNCPGPNDPAYLAPDFYK